MHFTQSIQSQLYRAPYTHNTHELFQLSVLLCIDVPLLSSLWMESITVEPVAVSLGTSANLWMHLLPFVMIRVIDDVYVNGVSLTHGNSPHQHIKTFASVLDEVLSQHCICPCTKTESLLILQILFGGNEHFCTSNCCHSQPVVHS